MPEPLNLDVPARAEAAQGVRELLRRHLAGRLDERELADAELVVTELLSNSMRHAGIPRNAPLAVRVSTGRGVLHLEVEDSGHAGAVRIRDADPITGGIGLKLVDALALAWGVHRDERTTVWVDLPFRATG
jgi:anti-sigma regulatory factor (Ser/Thr protein kinase)